jgi:hypothetical protein
MKEQQYKMTLTDVQWWCYDIPGNIGWIIWIVCNVKALMEGVNLFSTLMLIPTILMLIGVIELISERIAKLARVLPKIRLYRGFGSLTLGGLLGIPMAVTGLILKTQGTRPWWLLAGAVLCALFAGLCFRGYKRIEE